jgi:hypothetical protein
MQVVAQVPRASARQSSAILSSIEFDRDTTLFATAGVSKRISIFDFATVSQHQQTCMSSVCLGGKIMVSRHPTSGYLVCR